MQSCWPASASVPLAAPNAPLPAEVLRSPVKTAELPVFAQFCPDCFYIGTHTAASNAEILLPDFHPDSAWLQFPAKTIFQSTAVHSLYQQIIPTNRTLCY